MTKKMIKILLSLTLLFSFVACGKRNNDTNIEQNDKTEITDAQESDLSINDETTDEIKILVAYFSRADENYGVGVIEKGNTEIIAEIIADQLGADIFKIKRNTPYPSNYNECTDEAKKEQNENARPQLKTTLATLDEYDVIYLGMPVWWGDMPMPVYTFVESLNWNGKIVYPFTTHAGSGLANIPSTLQKECIGAVIMQGFTISGSIAQNNRDQAKSEILKWLGE